MKTKIQILLAALALTAPALSAQTFNIVREYKHLTTANGATQARQGVFANGKFYIHNWIGKTVEVWSQEGELLETFESKGTGPGICADEAGNVMIENTSNPWPASCGQVRDYRIFKKGQNDPVDISIKFDALREPDQDPDAEAYQGIRSDYFGPIEGDIMSAKGGYFACMAQHRPVINVAKIANGAPAENFSIWVDTAYVKGNVVCNVGYNDDTMLRNWRTYVENGAAYSQVNCFKYGNEIVMSKMMVGLKGYTYDTSTAGSHPVETLAYKATLSNDYTTVYDQTYNMGDAEPATYMSGGRLFEMGGKKYIIESIMIKNESANQNSFAIFDNETNRAVGVWHAFANKDYDRCVTACASWFTVVPVSDTKAEIYQYFPADGANRAYIAKYIFTLQ